MLCTYGTDSTGAYRPAVTCTVEKPTDRENSNSCMCKTQMWASVGGPLPALLSCASSESDGVVGRTCRSPRLEDWIWRIQHGFRSLVHTSVVTEHSLSSQRGLFMVIYNLVGSTPGAEGVWFALKAFQGGELPSAGRARVGSPDVCRPAHLRCSGVGVHLWVGGRLFKDPLFPKNASHFRILF